MRADQRQSRHRRSRQSQSCCSLSLKHPLEGPLQPFLEPTIWQGPSQGSRGGWKLWKRKPTISPSSMQIRGPPAPSASQAVARFSYEWSRQFPGSKYLPTQLGHYMYGSQKRTVILKMTVIGSQRRTVISEARRGVLEDRDLDHVLRTYLVQDKDKCQIFYLWWHSHQVRALSRYSACKGQTLCF